ncbi:MAG TPA: sigma 54-interacting transcriptional regulator [Chitinispirillaceae bacterium]|nr:sigma 54-interacting transcriptional regulator [Chitinispirillaceae bacterium]
MMSEFPRLHRIDNGSVYPLTGRIITIGSSKDCRIHLEHSSISSCAAHLLFTNGKYRLRKLSPEMKITVNGKALKESAELSHGDHLRLGEVEFTYREEGNSGKQQDAEPVSSPLHELIRIAVVLLRNRDENVFKELVTSVAKLLRCDASRLVDEDPVNGERRTITRYPETAGLDRFSERAIDWAGKASHTIVMSDQEWQCSTDSAGSLEKNLVGSVMCAPLKQGDTMIGYLYLDRIKNGESFSEDDRMFCDAILPLFTEILINFQERKRQQETIERLQKKNLDDSGGIIFESEVMSNLIQLAARLARTDSPVLILGETGTGKELMARFVHDRSARSDKPFKAINCGAIPENLIESELFGHEKGAFTGAVQRKIGLFEAAEGGTVFLDELGELPLQLQVKLLRVLQEAEVVRVGGTETVSVNIRIVAATNKKLDQEVREGRFRQDLYFRLNVLTLNLPPLRERGADVLLLAQYFTKKYCAQFGMPLKSISISAANQLSSYNWPGNIRELENIIQKAILLSETSKITPQDIVLQSKALTGSAVTLRQVRDSAEREAILSSLSRTRGNVSLASRMLDIDRKWLMKKMVELDIDAEEFRRTGI